MHHWLIVSFLIHNSLNPFPTQLLQALLNMNRIVLVTLIAALSSCASINHQPDDAMHKALTLCGLGSNSKAYDSIKIALESAAKKTSAGFENTANNEIETQITILLKQYAATSDPALKFAADQLNSTRECAIKEFNSMRKLSKAELIEECRVDVQNKLSPKGNTSYGTLRNWNTADGKLSGSKEYVEMVGYFDNGGRCSASLKATCDIKNGKFNESVITKYESGC